MLYVIRTILGILLGMLGTVSFFGTFLVIITGDGELREFIIPAATSIILFGFGAVVAPWMF